MSFVRVGTFEYFSAREGVESIRKLADYVIERNYPQVRESGQPYVALLQAVVDGQAALIARWMRLGFIHGVMNTDNMSILGLTIDYGPYGWLDNYDPDWTPNTTDAQNKRYRYGNQPTVAHWNLLQLAQSLAALTEEVEPLQVALGRYAEHYQTTWSQMLSNKLGLENSSDEVHQQLLKGVPDLLQMVETDMTIFFRQLARVTPNAELSDEQLLAPLHDAYYAPEAISGEQHARTADWLRKLIQQWRHSGVPDASRIQTMNAHNPKYVLRNYLAQQAINKAEQGDYSVIHELQTVLKNPYETQAENALYAEKRPDWARHRAGCSMLSCSS